MKTLVTLLGLNLFLLALPVLLLLAPRYASEDEQWLLSVAFWPCFPLSALLWYCVVRAIILSWRSRRA